MRTPWGFDCHYFYGDYYRGRKREECRLIGPQSAQQHWDPRLCRNCPVPGILRANACPNLILSARVDRQLLGIIKTMKVNATCTLSQAQVSEPHIGCGKCHTVNLSLGGDQHEPDHIN